MNDDNKKVNASTGNTDETEMSLDELDAVAGGAGNLTFESGDGYQTMCFGGAGKTVRFDPDKFKTR